jgi:two-component sensor histidine kinase
VIAVKQLFENEQRIIDCAIHSDDISIDINTAIPLGLIINEFLTNSYKYLPEEQANKKIEIELLQYNESYELIYKDNGPGLPSRVDFENTQTLGLRLVRGLANQIGGSVSYQYLSGSVFKIRFTPKFNKHTWEK